MYPQSELIRLSAQKTTLRLGIRRHRAECARAAARVAQPLAWVDRARGFLRRYAAFAPLVAVPMGLLVRRAVWPRLKFAGTLLKWGPLLLGVARKIGAAGANRR
jgi:hypothetical protein